MGHSDDNASPVWNFRCVREIENDKRERLERMGVIRAFDEDMKNLAKHSAPGVRTVKELSMY